MRLPWLLMLMVGLLGLSAPVQAGIAPKQGQQLSAGHNNIRAFHFVLRWVPLETAKRMIDVAHEAGFNTVAVTITDGVRLEHAPWTPLSDAWSKEEFKSWISYVKSKDMDIVPEFQLLTHQEKLFQKRYPKLMFNHNTYDPRKEEVYRLLFPLLAEVIELVQPRAVHIGHDELAGQQYGLAMLPADLFLKDVLRIHDYLKKRGIETWMWGDMLISPDEFPAMFARDLHGVFAGYGKVLRGKLPRDIVICDWHYVDDQKSFPSLAAMQQEGFRVIGAPWRKSKTIRNFSRYAAQHRAYGMMATTWFHVQYKEADVVEAIIRESGEVFSKDFPDAK